MHLSYKILIGMVLGVVAGLIAGCAVLGDFGPSGEGHIRISYATSTENCAEGARRIRAFLNNL